MSSDTGSPVEWRSTNWSETESPMMRQFGKVVDGSSGGPGEQQFVEFAKTVREELSN